MSQPSTGLSGRRVLVVEDEYFIANDIARALESLGAEIVGPVPSRDKALRLVADGERLDLAVLDINLRGDTVFPVADALRDRRVPFVFATGYDRSSVPSTYGDVPRWEKPFKAEQLAGFLPRLVALP